jgi:hypothetical protein
MLCSVKQLLRSGSISTRSLIFGQCCLASCSKTLVSTFHALFVVFMSYFDCNCSSIFCIANENLRNLSASHNELSPVFPLVSLHANEPHPISRNRNGPLQCLFLRIGPLNAQLIPLLDLVLPLELCLHSLQSAHFSRIA